MSNRDAFTQKQPNVNPEVCAYPGCTADGWAQETGYCRKHHYRLRAIQRKIERDTIAWTVATSSREELWRLARPSFLGVLVLGVVYERGKEQRVFAWHGGRLALDEARASAFQVLRDLTGMDSSTRYDGLDYGKLMNNPLRAAAADELARRRFIAGLLVGVTVDGNQFGRGAGLCDMCKGLLSEFIARTDPSPWHPQPYRDGFERWQDHDENGADWWKRGDDAGNGAAGKGGAA